MNDGNVNQKKLQENLSSAIDVYISRVSGAPCGSTHIQLHRRACSTEYHKENDLLKIFLKGKKKEKKALEEKEPEIYAKIKRIWELKERHVNFSTGLRLPTSHYQRKIHYVHLVKITAPNAHQNARDTI